MKDRDALIAGLQQTAGILEAFVQSIPADKLQENDPFGKSPGRNLALSAQR